MDAHLIVNCFCRAMLCKRGLCCHAAFVCVSVTFVNSVKTNKHIFRFFFPSASHTILVFPYQTSWRYSDGDPLTGASNAGGVGRNRDYELISGFIVCCQRCDWLDVINRAPPDCGKLRHLSLVASGGVCWWWDDEMFMTRSINVTPKTTERHFIVHNDKSVAYVTNNKRLCSTCCTIEANYWETRNTARPLCDSRATCN